MNRTALIATCMAALAGAAAAQSTDAAWVGRVTARDVNVRSAPSGDAYACLRLSRPAQVQVVEATGEWLAIEPPPGAFSVISRDFVEPSEDGRTGTVTGMNVNVRAGTRLYDWEGTTDHRQVQTRLDRGDSVVILGSAGDYYKIAPPEGVRFYITAQYVERVAAGEAEVEPIPLDGELEDEFEVDVDGEPDVDAEEDVEEVDADPESDDGKASVVIEESMEEVESAVEQFEALEAKLQAEFERPAEQRDLRKLLVAYRNLDVGKKGYLKPYVDSRIQFLEIALQRRVRREQIQEMIQDALQRQREFESARSRVEVGETGRPEPSFAATGVLRPSELYPGDGGRPRRYAVLEPGTRKTVAYAQSTRGTIAWSDYVGKRVGLVGERIHDGELTVIETETVVALSDEIELPEPPAPVVKPYTPPAPRPETGDLPRPIRPGPEPEPESVDIEPEPETPAEPAPSEPREPLGDEWETLGAEPVEPETVEVEPVPVEPEPGETEGAEPVRPAFEEPVEPEPVEPESVEPEPLEPESTDPDPGEEPAASDGDPLPPTGLPVGVPSTRPEDEGEETVDEEEFE